LAVRKEIKLEKILFSCVLLLDKKGYILMFKMTGNIIVHALQDVALKYVARDSQFLLLGEVNISDRTLEVAAYIIAQEENTTIVWQDICGNKHFVPPNSMFMKKDKYMLDPRDYSPSAKAYIYK
jgi:hypothetical protein